MHHVMHHVMQYVMQHVMHHAMHHVMHWPGEDMVIRERCADACADCEHWIRQGECQRNLAFMRAECPLSCAICGSGNGRPAPCVDDARCAGWAKERHCERNRRFMASSCRSACGWCGIEDASSSGTGAGQGQGQGQGPAACVDEDIKCETWVAQGECTRNPGFMLAECHRSCGACAAQPHRPPSAQLPQSPAASTPPRDCTDRFKDCASMSRAPVGCASRFMARNCRVACNLCHTKVAVHDEL